MADVAIIFHVLSCYSAAAYVGGCLVGESVPGAVGSMSDLPQLMPCAVSCRLSPVA